MSAIAPAFDSWLLRGLIGGGVLLLCAWPLMRQFRQPAWQQRLGEWGMIAALLLPVLCLAPAWLVLPVLQPIHSPANPESQPPATHKIAMGESDFVSPSNENWPNRGRVEVDTFGAGDAPHLVLVPQAAGQEETDHLPPRDQIHSAAIPLEETPVAAALSAPSVEGFLWIDWLLTAYLLGALILFGRWLLGYLGLRRLLRSARPAPQAVRNLFESMASDCSRVPRLLVSQRLRVPVSCGLLQPTVVVPARLCAPGAATTLRWVFAHELTHLERRDAWACLFFGLGQIVYYYLPWFWWLRRDVRLCQEYVADAAAVQQEADAGDYAQFLLTLSTAPAVPLGATGVSGNSSDLFRRVTMLLNVRERVEKACPRWWSVAAAGVLLSLAVLVAGVSLRAVAADVKEATANPVVDRDDSKDAPKKDDANKKAGKKPPRGQVADPDEPEALPFDPKNVEQMRERMRKMQEEMMQRMPQLQGNGGFLPGNPGMGGFFNRRNEGRLGVMAQQPSATLIDQLDLPKDQGLVLEQVEANSAAAKAGLKEHDILLEFNGKPVTHDVARFARAVSEIKAKTPVDAVVLRKGKKETVKGISLPEKPAAVQGFFGNQGVFGQQGFGQGAGGFQQFPAPPLAGVQAVPGFDGVQAQAIGGQTVMTSNFRTGDRFTTRHQEGSLIITVTGTVSDGKVKVSSVQVRDGNETHKYESVDKVPEEYHDKVKNLVELNEKSNLKIELRAGPDKKKLDQDKKDE